MCMRNQSKSSATAEQGWKDLCTQQIQVTIGIPPNETQFFQFFNINSIPTKISEKISCDKQCHIKPATKIWRHAKPSRGKHGMWGSVHAWNCATAGAHTCRLSGLEAKNFFFVGHHLLPVNRSTSMPTIVLFQQLYNSIKFSDINFLGTSSSGLWKANQAFAQSSQ